MSFRDFMYGFMQGFHNAGGTNRLSSYVARNIADGKFYDPFNDPLAMKEYQLAAETNIPALQNRFIEEYGPYMDYEIPEGMTGPRPLTLEQKKQQIFGIEPPTPTIYGMNEDEARNLMLRAAMEGLDIPENILTQYNEAFNYDITPLINTFTPEEKGPGYDEFMQAYVNALNIGTPFAKQSFVNRWQEFIPEGIGLEQLFPTGPVETEPPAWRGMNINQAINYIQSRAEKGYDVSGLVEDLNTAFKTNFSPEEFVVFAPAPVTDEGIDYSKYRPEELAALILADDEYTTGEQQIWEDTGYSIFGTPDAFLAGLTEEAPSGFDIDDSRIYGALPNGEIVYKTPAGGFITRDRILTPAEIQGIIPATQNEDFAMPENRKVIQAPDGRWLYENMSGYLVYEDGTPFMDDEGNRYYIGSDFFGGEQRILSTGSKNVLTGESDFGDFLFAGEEEADTEGEGGGLVQGVIDTLSNTFNNLFNNEPQTRYAPTDVINVLKQQLGTNSNEELMEALKLLSDEKKRLVEETYGYPISSLLTILRYSG